MKPQFSHARIVKKNHEESESYREEILSKLGVHFKISNIEKYDNAVIGLLFNDGIKKYRRHERVGEHVHSKIQKYMTEKLQQRYGPYVNVLRKKSKFMCNINQVYKTDKGRLFQSLTVPDLFITSHALERIEERLPSLNDIECTRGFKTMFKNRWGAFPTSFDLIEMLLYVTREYGIPVDRGDAIILNLYFGFLVLDVFEDFSIAKTFLLPGMDLPRCDWFKKNGHMTSMDESLLDDSESIDRPVNVYDLEDRLEEENIVL